VPDSDHETSAAVAAAWQRELPGVPTRSVPVIWATKTIAGRLRRGREAALHDAQIDAATLDLLSTLRRAGDPYFLTTRELAARCLVSAGAISQRISRAELDGLVRRRAGTGRRIEVVLTAAGHDFVERGARHVLNVDDALTAGLSDAELHQLETLLARWVEVS
jgi:DNA-binding MarR family transcriptional regulator